MVPTDSAPLSRKQPSMGRWIISWALGACASWILVYYLLFHLIIGIPLPLLYSPATIHVLATVLIGPLAFRAVHQFISSNRRDFGMFYFVAAMLLFCTAMCWTYFGIRAGMIPRDHMITLYAIASLGSIMGPLGAYFVRKSVVKPS